MGSAADRGERAPGAGSGTNRPDRTERARGHYPDRTGRVRARYRIHGRVQGVGFRWWSSRLARELRLGGVVRNLPDGSVEVIAEGPAPAIDELREQLRRGPGSARVERVEELSAPDGPLPLPFEITR